MNNDSEPMNSYNEESSSRPSNSLQLYNHVCFYNISYNYFSKSLCFFNFFNWFNLIYFYAC